MEPQRRRQIESVALEALARAAEERAAYLDTACAGDAGLRRDVESLLAGESAAALMLESPPWARQPPSPLAPRTRLGPYEIESAVGAGGMGEVYRARDTRLGRTVAIKVLPASLATDPERRHRFEQEARAVSALNHPHICPLFDIGESTIPNLESRIPSPGPIHYLVLAYVEGQTLAARLRKGPMPVAQVLEVGAQIADALGAAHRAGIVHRDLKPANVMLTKGRTDAEHQSGIHATLLDFGIAKLAGHGETAALAPDAETGVADAATSQGTILGTVPYMAPEQLEGRGADARTDIWALGALLHEMLTGSRAYQGDSPAAVAAAILEREPPPLSTVQPGAPPALARLVGKCLAKDPEGRWASAHDVADELRWMMSGIDAVTAASAVGWVAAWRRRHPVWLLGAGLLLGGLVAGAVVWRLRPPVVVSEKPVTRSMISLAPAERLGGSGVGFSFSPGGSRTGFTWTPDGRSLVFAGMQGKGRQIFVRKLNEDTARPLGETSGAQLPVVSPDGKWVAFWAGRAIRKVPLEGAGASSVVAEPLPGVPRGMSWAADGRLLFGANNCTPSACEEEGRIWIARSGSAPRPVTELRSGETTHGLPQWLPDGDRFLFTVRKSIWTWGHEELVVQSLATGVRKTLVVNAADGRYLPSGHLVFLRMGTLFAVRFDAETLEAQGEPFALLSNVTQALTGGNSLELTGAGQFSVTPAGHLAYLSGPVVPYRNSRVVSVDRRGAVTPLPAEPQSFFGWVRVSPEGQRLAIGTIQVTQGGLWVADLARGGALTSLTRAGVQETMLWAPDGRRVLFSWERDGVRQVAALPTDGPGAPQPIRVGAFDPSDISPDGKHVVGVVTTGATADIMTLSVDDPAAGLRPVVQTPAVEQSPVFSPDGAWLAYDSDASGRSEVYVQPYRETGPRVQVTTEGGMNALWNRNGRELFFVSMPVGGRMRMMSAALERTDPLRFAQPKSLFEFEFMKLHMVCLPVRCYDVSADGQRFFAILDEPVAPSPPVTQLNVVLNWVEELKAQVPGR